MNCLEYRRQITSDPRCGDAALLGHRAECTTCGAYADSIDRLDRLVGLALAVPVPDSVLDNVDAPTRGPARLTAPRWMALAASVLVAVGAGFAFWKAATPHSLHEDVIAHIFHEPDLFLLQPADRADAATVRTVLQRSQVSLKHDIGEVSHAGLCYFRGNLVAHLVVYGKNGPVTVLLLPDEHVDKPMPIHEEGFHGTILPLGEGAIAVVGSDDEDVRPVESKFSTAVEWRI